MEANLTVSVDVKTLPRLIGHLIAEEELKFEPLSRKVAKAAYYMDEGKIFEAAEILNESLEGILSIERRLKQCDNLIKGLGDAIKGSNEEQNNSIQDIVQQAKDASQFSDFLSKMGSEEEDDDQ
tara:strand:- start:527 stop:898 length:372 start_codon:yes stop_codon:yes gene_type:complete